MIPSSTRPLSSRSLQRFTLVELLTVLAIVAVLMGITVATVSGTSGVKTSARDLGKEIHLARQYAISQRQFIGIVLHDGNSFRACVVDSATDSPTFGEWIDGSTWGNLSSKVEYTFTTLGSATNVANVTRADGTTGSTRCLIFRPNGSLLLPTDTAIKVAPITESPQTSYHTLTVNWLTGRVDYEVRVN